MTKSILHACLVGMINLAGLSPLAMAGGEHEALVQEVRSAEQAFARSMAERDFEAFGAFVSEEAIFLSGGHADYGKQAVTRQWAAYFEGPTPPFSWEPEFVAVLESGRLALSTGPVFDASGQRVATFTSTWRLENDGQWRVVFDRGNPYCQAP